MDALVIFALSLTLVLVALVVVVLRREFSRGNQTFKRTVWNKKMSSTGCCYEADKSELELSSDFGGAVFKMTELTGREAMARRGGGVYLIYIAEGQKQRPIKAMISKTPMTMEAARSIIAIRRGRGSKGALNLYTYGEENALALARGSIELKPVLHHGGPTYNFDHYHRYYREEDGEDEKSPRVFFGEPVETTDQSP